MLFSQQAQAVPGPSGLPLAQAAQLVARARVSEFTAVADNAPRPDVFPMIDALDAIRAGDVARRVQAFVALQEFMNAPANFRRRFRSSLREFVTAGSFPSDMNAQRYIDQFMITEGEMDMGFEEIFDIHQPAQAQFVASQFEILDVENGWTMDEVTRGQELKYGKLSAKAAVVAYLMFGGGLSIDGVWWDDQKLFNIAQVLQGARTNSYFRKAKHFYGLLTSLGAGVNFNTGTDLTAKINGACAAILRDLQGKGIGVSRNVEFCVVHAPEDAGLVDAAILTRSDVAVQTSTSRERLQYRLRPIYTTHVPASGTGSGIYVVLPKGKLKGGYRMLPTLFGKFNQDRYADDLALWERYAGAIGETKQVKRITA